MDDQLKSDLTLAERAVRAAAAVTRGYYENPGKVEMKGGDFNAPVTAADREGEAKIVEILRGERPDDGIVGEEGASHNLEARRQWEVDALDGTILFTHQVPGWSSAVALLEDDVPIVTAFCEALTGKLWSAAAGRGAHERSKKLAVSACTELTQAVIHIALPNFRQQNPGHVHQAECVVRAAGGALALGAPTSSLALVAEGKIDAWVNSNVEPWDWHPGALLVQEAGGCLAEIDHWKVAAATPNLQQQILRLLGSPERVATPLLWNLTRRSEV